MIVSDARSNLGDAVRLSVPTMTAGVGWAALRRSRIALPLVIVLAAALLLVNESGYRRAADGLGAIEQIANARFALRQLHVLVLEAETGQRLYMLSGNRDFLLPYSRSVAAIEAHLARLHAIAEAWPEEKARLKTIDDLTRDKLSELKTTLEVFDAGRRRAALDLVQSGIGRERMREFEEAVNAIAASAAQRAQLTLAGQQQTLQHNRIALALLTLIGGLALGLNLFQSRRLDAERERRQSDLRAERDRLDAEVQQRTADLFEVARHLQSAREDERSRLARELHDELGGLLTAAKLDVARIRSRLRDAPPELTERITHLVSSLDAGIALKRRIIEDLRPSTLTHLGLKAAIEVLCREFAGRSETVVESDLADLRPDEATALTIYRLVQESLTNIAKYAQARRVGVSLHGDDSTIELSVTDDGVGFDPARIPRRSRGLAGMRFRVESSGGRLDLVSSPGAGVKVHARLPLRAPQAD